MKESVNVGVQFRSLQMAATYARFRGLVQHVLSPRRSCGDLREA
jgi:hypothetical protein